VGRQGPSCGWVLSYLELMLSEYHMTYQQVWRSFPVVVGFELLKARRERLGDGSEISDIDNAGLQAMKAERERLTTELHIID